MAPVKQQSSTLSSRVTNKTSLVSMSLRQISSRKHQKQNVLVENGHNNVSNAGKRKADASPTRNEKNFKRSALGNVTNSVLNAIDDSKKGITRTKNDTIQKLNTQNATKKSTVTNTIQNNEKTKNNGINNVFVAPNAVRGNKVVTRSSARATESTKSNGITDATNDLKKVNISTTIVKGKKKTENATNKATTKTDATLNNNSDVVNNTKTDAQNSKYNSRRLSNEFESMDGEESHYMSALEDL